MLGSETTEAAAAAAEGEGGGEGGEEFTNSCSTVTDSNHSGAMKSTKPRPLGPKAAASHGSELKQTTLLGFFSRAAAAKKGAATRTRSLEVTKPTSTVKRPRLDSSADGLGVPKNPDHQPSDGEEDPDVAPLKRRCVTRKRVFTIEDSEDECSQEQTGDGERFAAPARLESLPTNCTERFRYVPGRRGSRTDSKNSQHSAAGVLDEEKRRRHQRYVRIFGNPDFDTSTRSQGKANEGNNAELDPDDKTTCKAPLPEKNEIGTFAFAFSSTSKKPPYTPLEKQVFEIKKNNRDVLLLVEVGYKFRFFGEDAQIAARHLNIMCLLDRTGHFYSASIPVPRLMVHTKRLVKAGYKVGIVRQMETAALKATSDTKSQPFVRELTNIYTKGTFVDDASDDAFEVSGGSSYLMCLYEISKGGTGRDEHVEIGLLAVQPSTGDVVYDVFEDSHLRNELETRIMHIQPCEFIVPPAQSAHDEDSRKNENGSSPVLSHATDKVVDYLSRQGYGTSLDDTVRVERPVGLFLNGKDAFTLVTDFYAEGVVSSDGKSEESERRAQLFKDVLRFPKPVIICLAAMIRHLTAFGLEHVFRLTKFFAQFSSRETMLLNANTLANLEIFRNQLDYTVKGSLLWNLDYTLTPFGKRLLRTWVGRPLVDISALNEREDAVEELVEGIETDNPRVEKIRDLLKVLPDMEKNLCRVHYGKCPPSELWQLLSAFVNVAEAFPAKNSDIDGQESSSLDPQSYQSGFRSKLLCSIVRFMPKVRSDALRLLRMLQKEAALKGDKENLFDEGNDRFAEVMKCKEDIAAAERSLREHLKDIRQQLKMPTLQYSTIGATEYLLEVKHNVRPPVPKSWVKISNTKVAGRYHSPEILELLPILQACREKLTLASDRAYIAFLSSVAEHYELFRDATKKLATMDCLLSLASVARQPGYVKPQFVADTHVEVREGRHPMIERIIPEPFVPNDVTLNSGGSRTMIITGPNMGGKSSFIRMCALISIMGQIGSYVPAACARLGMLDAVYTRMGASDNMLKGESTFMVELKQTSEIMKRATPRSLVILDELGRGTSTHDGVAIAHAVLRHFVTNIKSLTLFVTHYPSLAELADEIPQHVSNYHMAFLSSTQNEPVDNTVLDTDEITFMYRITSGAAHRSYGLNVARLARLPPKVLEVAKRKSAELESITRRRHRKAEALAACRVVKLLDQQSAAHSSDSAKNDARVLRLLEVLLPLLDRRRGASTTVEDELD